MEVFLPASCLIRWHGWMWMIKTLLRTLVRMHGWHLICLKHGNWHCLVPTPIMWLKIHSICRLRSGRKGRHTKELRKWNRYWGIWCCLIRKNGGSISLMFWGWRKCKKTNIRDSIPQLLISVLMVWVITIFREVLSVRGKELILIMKILVWPPSWDVWTIHTMIVIYWQWMPVEMPLPSLAVIINGGSFRLYLLHG